MRRTLLVLAGVLAAWALPQEAWAGKDDPRPFSKGTFQPSLGLGASFGGDVSVVNIGLGARYFVVGGLGPGLSISDTILIYDEDTRANFPGIEEQTPTNIVRILPNLQWVFVRTRWFSPYVIGGVGPEFYNNGGGTVGAWMAGGGALIGLGGPVFVDLGVQFNGVFPVEQCREAFTYRTAGLSAELDSCSFTWGPRLGLTIAFGMGGGGGKRRGRKNQPEQEPRPTPPPERAWEPPPEPEPAPEPAPVEPETPSEPTEPETVQPEPVEPVPEGPEPVPEGPDEITAPPEPAPDAPTDIAAPPTDAAPEPAPPPPPNEG